VAWRAVFLVSVPFGLFGTVWGFLKLRDLSERKPAKIDWWGNVTFAIGLVAIMVGITYGIQPYGHHTMGWTSPKVIAEIGGGVLMLIVFCVIETRVEQPMFHLDLFKVRAFSAGNLASLLSGIGRGGLQFVLIIWLQGIFLPRHGYSFSSTPLWAGIYLLPLVAGMLFAGPIAGTLSDRIGPRPFAVAGMALAALSFLLLALLPVNFSYPVFALVIVLNGIGMGIFFSPNRASIMNSLPPNQRGAGGGMAATFMNSAMVLSIGVFFSLMIVGLSGGLHQSLYTGLRAHGVAAAAAAKAASLPPVATLFAAFLGYNPIQTLLGPAIKSVPVAQQHVLLGHSFFPAVISHPFSSALSSAFTFGLVACVIAGLASMVPDRGVPFIVRSRNRRAGAEPREQLAAVPAGATLEYAGADVAESGPRG
jgi:MFS family permease